MTKRRIQQELLFFDDGREPTKEERLWAVDQLNPDCPLNDFIGNEKAVRQLRRAAFKALERNNHAANDFSFALYGPASTGKTTLAGLFAKTLGVPFVVVQPQSVRKVEDIHKLIEQSVANPIVCSNGHRADLSLVETAPGRYHYPTVEVFLDEVHNLAKPVIQGLLKATERDDATLVTESGIVANCSNVCWVIATTDRGGIFDAFDTRFEKLQLRLYSKAEIAQIVQMANEDFSAEACRLISHYCPAVPREAKAFAKAMRIEAEMEDHNDWEKIAAAVADDKGIDEHGMSFQRVSVLKALGHRPISATQLPHFVTPRVKEEELRNFVMPPLQAVTPDQPVPLVVVSTKGYCITPAGLAELDKRGIKNMGEEAIPESIRDSLTLMYEDAA